MSYENIKSKFPHFTYISPYYYVFDNNLNILLKKTSNGGISFTYPINGDITEAEIISCEHDGFYFWTLQNVSDTLQIKKFIIDNFICYELNTFILDDNLGLNTTFDSECFTIEHYKTTFSGNLSSGNSYIPMNNYYEDISVGTVLNLGPNSTGNFESVTVTGTLYNNLVGLNFYTQYSYNDNDPISFSNSLLLFNNYRNRDVGGAVYKFSTNDFSYIERVDIDDVYQVTACTFAKYQVSSYIFYIKQSNLRIADIDFNMYKTSNIDTVKTDDVSFFTVYDLAVLYPEVIRLQKGSNYFDVDIVQSTYNFITSPLTPLLDSVSLGIWPKILPNDGISTVELKVIAADQFSDPLISAEVNIIDDDNIGFVTISKTYTDKDGEAISYYKSGIDPRTVTIDVEIIHFS